MIILILLIIIGLFIIGRILHNKDLFWDENDDFGYGVWTFILVFLFSIALFTTGCLIQGTLKLSTIDSKIAMYTEANAKIESQIETAVKQYQSYESNTYTELAPDSYITLVSIYPELKSDKKER